jgi:hypothetical protein
MKVTIDTNELTAEQRPAFNVLMLKLIGVVKEKMEYTSQLVEQNSEPTTTPAVANPPLPQNVIVTGPGGVELDSNGLPWDARIHSEGRAKLTDGGWRKRRNVAPELFAQVETELRALMAVPQGPTPEQAFAAQVTTATGIVPQAPAPATFVPAPPPPAPIAQPTPDPLAIPAFLDRSLQAAQVAPPPPPVVTAAPAPAPVVATGATQQDLYIALVGRASAAVQAGKITQEEIATACTKFGVPALPLVCNRPDLLGVIANEIDTIIASRV